MKNKDIAGSMNIKLDRIFPQLPEAKPFREDIRRAPVRPLTLSEKEISLALKNALRYIPENWHAKLAPEFTSELLTKGRIYGYRFRPEGSIRGLPIEKYRGNCIEGKAFQVMMDNNLDFDIALYPYELVTYGETGQVCQNWMQYNLIKAYLQVLTENQTLVLESGHPLGIFRSHPSSPRVIITNGLMVGLFDDPENWSRGAALGVTNYGQMTAGGLMYIGPQGIVHGTYNTVLNAGRIKLGNPDRKDLKGTLFVSSGLGGMSGAQGRSVEIAKGVAIIAEVDPSRIRTRYDQGWVRIITDDPSEAFSKAKNFIERKEGISIAFSGNIIDLLDYAVENNVQIDLLSDQTSCHVVHEGGYCPAGISFDERTELLSNNPEKFRMLVDRSLVRHYALIKKLTEQGAYFFDYGNSFLKSIYDAGVDEICVNRGNLNEGFIFPSYVEDIMGPLLFDYGYGPFRWVCLSGNDDDLQKTDEAAMECIDPDRRFQDYDNYVWIRDARKNKLVVGTRARILYQDASGRVQIALKFNEMVRKGEIGPVILGRDHHDTGGTDSPFRETANIKDGSNITADMAVQCFAGNAARGMSLVALHNGGGVGIGNAINGGYGLVLDGSSRIDDVIRSAVSWDVMGGVARRSWARNENSIAVSRDYNEENSDQITLPFIADDRLIRETVEKALGHND